MLQVILPMFFGELAIKSDKKLLLLKEYVATALHMTSSITRTHLSQISMERLFT